MKNPIRWWAAAPFVVPAIAGAHALPNGVPHSHDAATWGGFAAATVLCWAAYRGAQWLSSRRDAARRRPDGRRADGRR